MTHYKTENGELVKKKGIVIERRSGLISRFYIRDMENEMEYDYDKSYFSSDKFDSLRKEETIGIKVDFTVVDNTYVEILGTSNVIESIKKYLL